MKVLSGGRLDVRSRADLEAGSANYVEQKQKRQRMGAGRISRLLGYRRKVKEHLDGAQPTCLARNTSPTQGLLCRGIVRMALTAARKEGAVDSRDSVCSPHHCAPHTGLDSHGH